MLGALCLICPQEIPHHAYMPREPSPSDTLTLAPASTHLSAADTDGESYWSVSMHSPQVELLRRQFFQMIDVRRLCFPSATQLIRVQAQEQIHRTIFAEPEPVGTRNYRLRVLKLIVGLIIQACEELQEDEISDDLTSCLASLLMSPTSESTAQSSFDSIAPQLSVIRYTPPQPLDRVASIQNMIELHETTNIFSHAGTTGHRTWEASLHLCHYLCSPCSALPQLQGSKVLELGAGRGMLSYLCADHAQVGLVIPTDGTEALVRQLRAHPAQRSESWEPWHLDWELDEGDGSVSALPSSLIEDLDVIIGADITFDVRILPSLATTLASLMSLSPRARVLIAATRRNEATLTTFEKSCGEYHGSKMVSGITSLKQPRALSLRAVVD